MIPKSRWFFIGFSKSQHRFLMPDELALAGAWIGPSGHLEHHPDLVLRHFTGKQDMTGRPLFEDDIVEFDQITEFGLVRRRGYMKWIDPPGHYSIVMDGAIENAGDQYITQNVRRIGSMLEDPELVKQPPQT